MLIDVRHGLYSRVAVHSRWGVSLGRWDNAQCNFSIYYLSGPLKGGLLVLRKSVIVVDVTQ
jgi:hypothetical protein